MKKVYASVVAALVTLSASSKVVKVLDIPYGINSKPLSALISSEEKYTIDSLCVKGSWDSSNFKFLKDCVENGRLTGIDLSEANVPEVPSMAFCQAKINSAAGVDNADGNGFLSQLQYIRLPKTVKTIGDHAFFMTSLRSITLPKVKSIGAGAFENCPFLVEVKATLPSPPTVEDMHAFDGSDKDATLCVPAGCTAAYASNPAWAGFRSVKEEEGLFVVRNYRLDELTLESLMGDEMCMVDSMKVSGYITLDDLAVLRKNVLHGRLTGIDLSDSRIENDELPNRAFVDVGPTIDGMSTLIVPMYLLNLKLPEGIRSLGSRALQKADLQSFTIPSTVKEIKSECFYLATIGSDLRIPEGVESIGTGAFVRAKIKGDVYLPSTLALAEDMAIELSITCIKDKKFYFNRMTPPGSKYGYNGGPVFMEPAYGCTLYVPTGAKAAFESDIYWNGFSEIIETSALDGGKGSGIAGPVSGSDMERDRIYTLDGRYLGSDIKALKSGVYVINGKKVVK